jgi:hypothetical protein
MTELTASAVVYGKRDMAVSINRSWLDAALEFLSSHGLPVREFEMRRTRTSAWARYPWPKDQDRIFREVDTGHVRVLEVFAHPEEKQDLVSCWHGLAYINLDDSCAFFGLPAALAVPPAELLRAADRLASLIAPFQYGISYLLPAANGPLWYAVGIGSHRPRDTSPRQSPETKSKLRKWRNNHLTTQTYLHGSFRDVYPANLLGEDHVRAALPGGKTLESLGIGRLSLLGPGKWLWEVSEEEIPRAQAVLREAGLLICG